MQIVEIRGYQDNPFEGSFEFNDIEMLKFLDGVIVICKIRIRLDGWRDNNVPANNTQDIIYVAADNIENETSKYSFSDKGMRFNSFYNIFHPSWIAKDNKIIVGRGILSPLQSKMEIITGQRYFVVTPDESIKVSWDEMRKLIEEGAK